MLGLRKVAVTGGLSCGKSSVCRILKECGAYVLSADDIVHQLLSSDTNLGEKIVNLLGPQVWVDQKLDRSRIARIVFHNFELLQALEALIHPLVYARLNKEYQRQRISPQPPPIFVAEIPLLFESGGQKDYDNTIAVLASWKNCFERFHIATGQNQLEFKNRMNRQFPFFLKAMLADHVIFNNGTLAELQEKTDKLYQELITS